MKLLAFVCFFFVNVGFVCCKTLSVAVGGDVAISFGTERSRHCMIHYLKALKAIMCLFACIFESITIQTQNSHLKGDDVRLQGVRIGVSCWVKVPEVTVITLIIVIIVIISELLFLVGGQGYC